MCKRSGSESTRIEELWSGEFGSTHPPVLPDLKLVEHGHLDRAQG